MKYQLIENYFETALFQGAVRDYFDTILGNIIAKDASVSAKGLFIVDGEQKRDYYDMPYHIHILNGLVPALLVYEHYMVEQGYVKDPEAELYLRVFMLGFTFHDANKLLNTQAESNKSDLEVAVAALDSYVDEWQVDAFLPEFERYKNNIYFLALATENGTWATAEDYPVTLENRDEIRMTQRELCHLADGLASIQNESLESIEALHKAVSRSVGRIAKIAQLRVSYVKIRPNPYTLLSQNLLQVARQVLATNGKKVVYATREGFVFWGEEVSQNEYEAIRKAYLKGSAEDIKFKELTKIDAQKCKFGFIGSTPFTRHILSEITDKLGDKFLSLSPNGSEGISDFDGFVSFTGQLIEVYDLPVESDLRNGRLVLRYHEQIEDEYDAYFKTTFNLHKIQWLNSKDNDSWRQDFDDWQKSERQLPEPIQFDGASGPVTLQTTQELLTFIRERVKTTNALYKTYLNFVKTYDLLQEEEDIEAYIAMLQDQIIDHFEPEEAGENVKEMLFDRYFECPGQANLQFLQQYAPSVPPKKAMCAFTGGVGEVAYKAEVAFAMKARGFSNRTVTNLNNNTSYISSLFSEENKLRASLFRMSEANLVLYYDFFEANLDIEKDIIKGCIKAKDEMKLLEDGKVALDKNSKFEYNLYNLEFIKLDTKVEASFFLVRKCLRMARELGIRTYISGIMTPYTPHKAVFHFENAPQFLKLLGWDSVRLIHVDEVLDEIRLVLTFGKGGIESNLLKIARSRRAYFTLYYLLGAEDQKKVYTSLINFYTKYKQKFQSMTVTEKLAELAVKIDVGFNTAAEETWLIRTAMDFLRKYHKQGSSREDIIQKTNGEIYRKLRMDKPDTEAIEAFSTAVYDQLFKQDWQGQIPAVNVEKDWIYQFAFLFREQSLMKIRTPMARKILETLEAEGKETNEENIKACLPEKQRRNAAQYLEIIKNLKKNQQ